MLKFPLVVGVAIVLIASITALKSGKSLPGADKTCAQCQEAGFTWYCAKDSSCYSTKDTCDVGCDWQEGATSSDCTNTQTCAPPSACTSEQAADCGAGNSCCIDGDNYQAFCTTGKATCCNYNTMTCPQGNACDPPTGKCVPPSPTPSKLCDVCVKLVDFIEGDGCGEPCGWLPFPFSTACNILMDEGLCTYIENHLLKNMTKRHICDDLGACSETSCSCGFCVPDLYGQWCLATPNTCPPSLPGAEHHRGKVMLPSGPRSDLHIVREGPFKGVRFQSSKPHSNLTAHKVGQFCADGMCDATNAGCCLTCAP